MVRIDLKGELHFSVFDRLSVARQYQTGAHIVIDSGGGSGWEMEGVLREIQALREDSIAVVGTVVGEAFSAAFVILQACSRREAVAAAKLMFHPPDVSMPAAGYSMGGESAVDPEDPRYVDFLTALSARTEIPTARLGEWGAAERYFTAQEALQYGFIDQIVEIPSA